eukprot:gene56408-75317_t
MELIQTVRSPITHPDNLSNSNSNDHLNLNDDATSDVGDDIKGKGTDGLRSTIKFPISSLKEVEQPRNNSKAVTIFLILNTMIGSGILNQPQVFQQAGVF